MRHKRSSVPALDLTPRSDASDDRESSSGSAQGWAEGINTDNFARAQNSARSPRKYSDGPPAIALSKSQPRMHTPSSDDTSATVVAVFH